MNANAVNALTLALAANCWCLCLTSVESAEKLSTPAPISTNAPGTVASTQAPLGTNLFVNSLGMRFVSIPGTSVRLCIWETRVQDYQAFIEATERRWSEPGFQQGPSHPVVNVSWEDAVAFCSWLTGKEKNAGLLQPGWKYRLPTDDEWTRAVLCETNTPATPEGRMKARRVWPWGHYWPPLPGDGNLGTELKVDTFENTSPVGSFKPNAFGLYDMGGNVWEWCDDWYNTAGVTRTLRGGSFNDSLPSYLASEYRFSGTMNLVSEDIGFRVVLDTTPPQRRRQPQ